MAPDIAQSDRALNELLELIRELNTRFLGPELGNERPEDLTEGRLYLLQSLLSALDSQIGADPDRPVFHRIVAPNKKVLGDNPDALYFGAYIRPDRAYRVRGNIAGAVFTSFSQELGTADGHYSKGTVNVVKDTQLQVDPEGNYEFILAPERRPGNWFPLHPEAGLINTRHFFEEEKPAAADPHKRIPLTIENLDPPGPPAPLEDGKVAATIRRVMNYMRGMTLENPPTASGPQPNWVSTVPNQFNPPADPPAGLGWANMDAVYAMAPYELQPDQALIIEGRFPKCRFASVMLYNRYLQTFDFVNRRVSLNRKQTKLEPDGSFRMVLAHSDPGVPNWIDTDGHVRGRLFWRFLLPEERLQPLRTRVVPVTEVAGK